jgi:hypothetical protein
MHELDYCTSALDEAAQWDVKIASQIAGHLKLRHTVLPFLPPTDDERGDWLASTGYCVGGRISYGFKTISQHLAGRVALMGHAGAVGTALFARGVGKATRIDASLLLRKLRLPETEAAKSAAEAWLGEVPRLDARQIMDLLYIEQRLGCWAAPQMIAAGPVKFRMSPYNQRVIFERMLDTPHDLRRRKQIHAEIIKLMNGQLMIFPHRPVAFAAHFKRALKRLGFPPGWRRLLENA